jgi:phosphate transport system substrate-binding protein
MHFRSTFLLLLALLVIRPPVRADAIPAPLSPADFVRQGTPADEPVKPFSGSAAERRARLADRARSVSGLQFDLSGLPAYQPKTRITGKIRLWGNNYVGDSGLAGRWRDAFKKFHPDAEFELVLPTAAVAVPALYFGLADLGMNHEPTFYDYLGHVRILGYEPTGFSWSRARSTSAAGKTPSPSSCTRTTRSPRSRWRNLTVIFGSARAGGWEGSKWRPDFARGPEKNIRTWGQLGLKGEWAKQRLNLYGYSIRYATALEFSNKILRGSDKWNEDILAYGNYVSPEGKRTLQAEAIIARMKEDKQGIAYIRWQKGFAQDVKVLALAETAGGPYYDLTAQNLQARHYPLWGDQSFWVSIKPGTRIDPKAAGVHPLRPQPRGPAARHGGRQIPAAARRRGAGRAGQAGQGRMIAPHFPATTTTP